MMQGDSLCGTEDTAMWEEHLGVQRRWLHLGIMHWLHGHSPSSPQEPPNVVSDLNLIFFSEMCKSSYAQTRGTYTGKVFPEVHNASAQHQHCYGTDLIACDELNLSFFKIKYFLWSIEIKLRMSTAALLSREQRAVVGQPTEVCVNKQQHVPTKTSVLSLQSCFKLHSGT